MAGMKHSRQRDAILAFLRTRTDHPTADVIHENIRAEQPKVSLGTVYRNLALLCELGEIMKLDAGDGREHYDWNSAPHSHFVCRECGAVLDIPYKSPAGLLEKASEGFGGRIDSYAAWFYGICPECVGREAESLLTEREGA